MFITFLDTNEMVRYDEWNPDWNIVIMAKLFFLPPTPTLFHFSSSCSPSPALFSMAAYNPPFSKPFMISLWMPEG